MHFPIAKEEVQADAAGFTKRFQQVTMDACVAPTQTVVRGVRHGIVEKENQSFFQLFLRFLAEESSTVSRRIAFLRAKLPATYFSGES